MNRHCDDRFEDGRDERIINNIQQMSQNQSITRMNHGIRFGASAWLTRLHLGQKKGTCIGPLVFFTTHRSDVHLAYASPDIRRSHHRSNQRLL